MPIVLRSDSAAEMDKAVRRLIDAGVSSAKRQKEPDWSDIGTRNQYPHVVWVDFRDEEVAQLVIAAMYRKGRRRR